MNMLRVWRTPAVAVLLSGQFVSTIGNSAFGIALYWYVLSGTHSRMALGLVGMASSLAMATGLLSGMFVDRWDRRNTMIVSDIIRGVLALFLALLASIGRLGLPTVLLIVLCIEVAGAFFTPAELSLLPTLVDGDQLAEVNGTNTTLSSAAQLVGQGAGGAVLGLVGPVLLFIANGLSFAVSVVSLLFIPRGVRAVQGDTAESRKTVVETIRGMRRDLTDGYRLIFRSRFLKRVIAVGAVANFFLQPLGVL